MSCRTQSFRPVVSRGRFCPAGCRCGGFATGTLLAWLCRLGLGRVRGLCLAWALLSCRVLLRRLRRRDSLEVAVPLGLGLVLGLRLTLVRLSNRVQLRRLCRRARLGLLCHWIDTWCNEVGLCFTSVRCGGEYCCPLFPLYKQSPPLRGGCRRQPAGGGVIYAPTPPPSLVPGRRGNAVPLRLCFKHFQAVLLGIAPEKSYM